MRPLNKSIKIFDSPVKRVTDNDRKRSDSVAIGSSAAILRPQWLLFVAEVTRAGRAAPSSCGCRGNLLLSLAISPSLVPPSSARPTTLAFVGLSRSPYYSFLLPPLALPLPCGCRKGGLAPPAPRYFSLLAPCSSSPPLLSNDLHSSLPSFCDCCWRIEDCRNKTIELTAPSRI